MPSPTCQAKNGAAAYVALDNGIDVTPGNTVTIKLVSSAGVTSWSLACVSTDDSSDAAAITAALTIDNVTKTATFTAPALGKKLLFRSVVNGGVDPNGRVDATYATTFAVCTLTAGGRRVLALNEVTESSAIFGWIADVNALIRNPSGGGSVPTGTGVRKVVGGVENAAASLIANADVASGAAIASSKLAPPGSTTQVIYNLAGAFAAAANVDVTATGLALGATPSQATYGLALTNASGITSRNGANTADLNLCTMTSANQISIGQTSGTAGNIALLLPDAATHYLSSATVDRLVLTNTLATFAVPVALGSGTFATTGTIRLPYAATDTIIGAKDSTATDRKVIWRNAADSYVIGDTALNTFNWSINAFVLNCNFGSTFSVVGTVAGVNRPVISYNGGAVQVGDFTGIGSILNRVTAGGLIYNQVNGSNQLTIVETELRAHVPIANASLGDINGLRLTLSSGNPIPTADVTSSTIYLTPYKSGSVSLYDTTLSMWILRSTSEVSQTFSGMTAGSNYDVFAYWSGSAVTLERAIWTNDTTRATALARQDGVLVKSGDATRRYLGTFRAISATQTTDTASTRFLYNEYNQVDRHLRYTTATASWTYASTVLRQANATVSNRVEVVLGQPQFASARLSITYLPSASNLGPVPAIGIDNTTVASSIHQYNVNTGAATFWGSAEAVFEDVMTAGYHAMNWLEACTGASTVTFYGTNGATSVLRARIRM